MFVMAEVLTVLWAWICLCGCNLGFFLKHSFKGYIHIAEGLDVVGLFSAGILAEFSGGSMLVSCARLFPLSLGCTYIGMAAPLRFALSGLSLYSE